jgi:hypothetical protein
MKKTIYATLLCSILSGCASSIGSVENTVSPPKLIKGPDGVVIWDNISAFGPIPKEKLQEFKNVCETANPKWYAAGYNSKAQNVDGKPFPDGGFICLSK